MTEKTNLIQERQIICLFGQTATFTTETETNTDRDETH